MKFIRSIILSLLISANVNLLISLPAIAISTNVVIAQLQTGGSGSGTASQEFILIHNNSAQDINVSSWCVGYSSASNGSTFSQLACINPPDASTELWLSAGGFVSFATSEFVTANPGFVPDATFSAGIAATGGHVRLIDQVDTEIDRVGWGGAVAPEGLAASAHISGQVLSRDLVTFAADTDVNLVDFSSESILSSIVSGLYEQDIIIDLCPNIDEVQAELPLGFLQDENGDCFEDFCPNLEDLQLEAPSGYIKPEGEEDCVPIPLEDAVLYITELLPNPPSYDGGLEFIEIYNPNATAIDLTGYTLQLGPSFTKTFSFTDGIIAPGQYLTFSDSFTGIILPNTSATTMRLIAPAGNLVDETGVYSNVADDVSWALVDDIWIFTNQITPGAANKPYLVEPEDEVLGVTTVYAPCPAGKFRNPATNRCKNIETAVSQLVPCNKDQYRNPATNRCKKLANSSLVPCKEGQERNPETNRCRKTSVLGDVSALTKVTDIPIEQTEGRINWLIISSALLATLGYMLYEWRFELRQKLYFLKRV